MKPSCVLSRYEKQYAIFLLSFFAQCTSQLHSGLLWKVALSGFTIPDMLPTATKHSERAAQNMSQEVCQINLFVLFSFSFFLLLYYLHSRDIVGQIQKVFFLGLVTKRSLR